MPLRSSTEEPTGAGSRSIVATWTGSGAAFWGWEAGRPVPGDRLRRSAAGVVGRWWAERDAVLDTVELTLPDQDVVDVPTTPATPQTLNHLQTDS